ncbi:MAG: hypothetical protein M0P76_06965 [Candidatus Pacebacteria bacterium]|jgi:hypothetical protein|nr:hypothetical protein [Candidatus Paceibacterota bacterium]
METKLILLIVLAVLTILVGIGNALGTLGKEKLFAKEHIHYGKIIGTYDLTTPEVIVEISGLRHIVPVTPEYADDLISGRKPMCETIAIGIKTNPISGKNEARIIENS